jgi:hypothetical protein
MEIIEVAAASVVRYLLGRPFGKLKLYTHWAPCRRHRLHAPVVFDSDRAHRSFWPWHRSHDCRIVVVAAVVVSEPKFCDILAMCAALFLQEVMV